MEDAPIMSLADLIATTTERETLLQTGRSALWCTPDAARSLFHTVSRRDMKFKGLVAQSVRLVRAMALADGNGLTGFLYMNSRLPVLRARHFQNSFAYAIAGGRLTGIAGIDNDGGSLRFLEPEMASKSGEPFDIAFAQMPLIVALIDVAYLGITPDRFMELCAPIMSQKPQSTAAAVSIALTAELLNWMNPLLESDHFTRQASAMRGFCQQMRIDQPELIDDQFIFDFWENQCCDGTVDGFRQFTSAAHNIVAYRRKWLDVRQERNLLNPLHFVGSDEDGKGGFHLDRERVEPVSTVEWVSPLSILFSPPCDQGKWLFDDDRTFLRHLVCEPKIIGGKAAKEKDAKSLFSDEPPVRTLYRSVLRFTFFQSFQRAMSTGAKLGEFQDFAAVFDHFGTIERKLSGTLAYVTKLLAERNNPVAARAIVHQFPATRHIVQERMAISHIDDGVDPEDIDYLETLIPELLSFTLDDGKTVRSRIGVHLVNRAGLRVSDFNARDGEATFEAGLDALLDLHRYLSSYLDWLSCQNLKRCFEEDMAMFTPCLERLYGGIRRHGATTD